MDSQLIESLAEATDVPLSPLAKLRLGVDNFTHRARLSTQRLWDQFDFVSVNGRVKNLVDRNRKCGAAVLSRRPPVFLVPIGGARPLWMVETLGSYFAKERVLFFLLIYWSLENPSGVQIIKRNAELHQSRFSKQKLVFLCNTPAEQLLLDAAGLEAVTVHQNQIVSEQTFHPLDDAAITYDAVYNAKIARFKRHHLAAAIERLLYVSYRCPNDMSPSAGRAYVQRMLSRSQQHQFANSLVDGLPSQLGPDEVNRAHNQAAVGLCLSQVEGAMYASIEYLLAGLPIVTTPSHGGREAFFDADYCVTVAPEVRAVRDAVVALRDRKIPRSLIRNRTLERIESERRRSRVILERILERHGVALQGASVWPPPQGLDAIVNDRVRFHVDRWRAFGSDGTGNV
jgi:glycosyltransferase involved in cell wall biosynthesis